MSGGELTPQGKSTSMSSPPQNGCTDSIHLDSGKAMQELHLQSPAQEVDDHLIEFSEAMRTVAKALRQVAEGKASAQAEAAEWKRKCELERVQNLQHEHKGTISNQKIQLLFDHILQNEN